MAACEKKTTPDNITTFDTLSKIQTNGDSSCFSDLSLEDIRLGQAYFAAERDWNQFHSPRNLTMALVGEVGELCECFQWKGECKPGLPNFSAEERAHVGEELADVLLYLVRLSDRCGIDLSAAVKDKFEKNRQKYPASLVRGSSKKYSEYDVNETSNPSTEDKLNAVSTQ